MKLSFLHESLCIVACAFLLGLPTGLFAQNASFTQSATEICTGKQTIFSSNASSDCSSFTNSLNIQGIGTANASLVSTAIDNITMEIWVKWTPKPDDGNQMIFYNGNSGTSGYGIFLGSSGTIQGFAGGKGWFGSATLVPNIWQHVALVRSSGAWSLYVNGVEYSTGSSLVPRTPTLGTYVGCNNSGGENFDGLTSQAAFWNVARSTAQIQTDMKTCSISGTGLAEYWSLNNTANGANGKNLALSNTSYHSSVPNLKANTSYAWDFGDGTTLNSLAADASHIYTTENTYTVSLTVNSGGNSAGSSNQIVIDPTPTASISGSATGCGSTQLTASGGTTYLWTSGSSLNTAVNTIITNSTPSVTVSNIYGCSATASQSVTITPVTVAGTITANQTIALGAVGSGNTTILGDHNVSTNSGLYMYDNGQSIAQSFKPSMSATLTRVAISVNDIYMNDGFFTLSVVSGDGKYGTVLSSQTVSVSNGINDFALASPIAVMQGTTYTFVLTASSDNYFLALDYSYDDVYAVGQAYDNNNNASGDMYFKLYYQLPAANWTDIALSGYTGNVLKWQSASNSSFTSPTNILNTNTTLYAAAVGDLSATTYFRAVVQSGNCAILNSNLVTITVGTAANTWIGAEQADANNASNWSIGVPTSASDVVIANTVPKLSSNLSVNSVEISSGVNINGKTFTINGTVSGNGVLTGSATSGLVMNGKGTLYLNQSTSGNSNALHTFTINSPDTVKLGSDVNIVDFLNPTAGVFMLGNNSVTLKSSSISNTAEVGLVGANINYNGSGRFIAERFINNTRRGYRNLSSMGIYSDGNINDNWQEGASTANYNPKAGFGIQITGTRGAAGTIDVTTGLDATQTGNPSLWKYALSDAFSPIINTINQKLLPFEGYFAIIRGNRSYDLASPSPDLNVASTILRAKGKLATGNITLSSNSNPEWQYSATESSSYRLNKNTTPSGKSDNNYGFSLLANPYACSIDWQKVYNRSVALSTSQSLSPYYWVWNQAANDNTGGYVTVNQNGVSTLPINSTIIQPGQSFFIQNDHSGNDVVIAFQESDKVTDKTSNPLKDVFSVPEFSQLRVMLIKDSLLVDGTVALFSNNFSKAVDKEDAYKYTNPNENIAINNNGKHLAIEATQVPLASDTIALATSGLSISTPYHLQIDASGFAVNALTPYLLDAYKNTITLLSTTNVNLVNFVVDANASSINNRFSIVFKPAVLSVKTITLKAAKQTDGILLSWKTIGETDALIHEIERSENGENFIKIASVTAKNTVTSQYSWKDATAFVCNHYYRIKIIDKTNTATFSEVVFVPIDKHESFANVYPNPAIGKKIQLHFANPLIALHNIAIYNNLGKIVANQIVSAGQTAVEVNVASFLAGMYSIVVRDSLGKISYQTSVMVTEQ